MTRARTLAGMRPLGVALAAALGMSAWGARPAEARLLDLHVGGDVGGIAGWGATPNTPDFFEHTRGAGVGFDLGVKLLVFDLSANFTQVFNSSGTSGTLTQFLLGIVIDVPVGPAKLSNGQAANIIRPSVAAGFGFGTPGPVNPPLDDAQISDKGFVSQGKVEYEYFFDPYVALGAKGIFGYHYFLGGDAVNSVEGHSSGYHVAGFGTVTFHLGI